MPRDKETFGQRLRTARHRAGLSQAQLARRSGIPKTTLSRYENDRILPSMRSLERLAAALGVRGASLIGSRREGPLDEFVSALRARGIAPRTSRQAQALADRIAALLDRERTG